MKKFFIITNLNITCLSISWSMYENEISKYFLRRPSHFLYAICNKENPEIKICLEKTISYFIFFTTGLFDSTAELISFFSVLHN